MYFTLLYYPTKPVYFISGCIIRTDNQRKINLFNENWKKAKTGKKTFCQKTAKVTKLQPTQS